MILGIGEVGIGNTSTSAAVVSFIRFRCRFNCGKGQDTEEHINKKEVIRKV